MANTTDTRGNLTQQLWDNGVVTQTRFDAVSGQLNRITSGRLTAANNNLDNLYGDIQHLSYTYDSLGNFYSRAAARVDNNGLPYESLTESFTYDKLNRLKQSTTTSTSSVFGRTQSYHYDLLGNLTNRSDTLSGSATNYDVGTLQYEGVRNAGIHAVTAANGINYSYDAYGNMTQRGTETLQYNVFNKPTNITAGATVTNFTYNGEDELFKETTGTKSTYKLFGGVYDVTVNGSTRIEKSYVDGVILNTRTVVSGTQTQNDIQYLHSDHLGSTEAVTNALGQFVTRMSFSTWGERQTKDWAPGPLTSTELNNLNAITTNGYTGHDQVDQHNLIHMGGRVYDPNLGRFLSADLFVVDPYSANSFNRYTYVSNNPLSRIDPTGYWDRASDTSEEIKRRMNEKRDYPSCGSGKRGPCLDQDGVLNLPIGGGQPQEPEAPQRELPYDGPTILRGDAAFNYLSEMSFSDRLGSSLPALPNGALNFGVGLGNAISFGAGGLISEWWNGAGSFDANSQAYLLGSIAGVVSPGGWVKGGATASTRAVALVNPTYNSLKGMGIVGFQAHHILPQYLGKMLGYTTKQMGNHPATLISQWAHTGKGNLSAMHKAIDKYLPPMAQGQKAQYSPQQIYSGLEKAYSDIGRADLFNSIKHLIR